MQLSKIETHSKEVDFPILTIQIFVGCINIFQLLAVVNFMQSIVKKDDPFQNGSLICLQVFFVSIQRIVFTSLLTPTLRSKENDEGKVADPKTAYDLLTTARYATMAMEFLFILLPLRHNFIPYNIEF